MNEGLTIRAETPGDYDLIRTVNNAAFSQEDESKLIDRLRAEHRFTPEMSRVAILDGTLVGHILFSDVRLLLDGTVRKAAALAPLAVTPQYQRKGIGSALIQDGLKHLRAIGYEVIVVLGHKDYYPRFGFSVDLARKIKSKYAGEHFMALELTNRLLSAAKVGEVHYPSAFEAV